MIIFRFQVEQIISVALLLLCHHIRIKKVFSYYFPLPYLERDGTIIQRFFLSLNHPARRLLMERKVSEFETAIENRTLQWN